MGNGLGGGLRKVIEVGHRGNAEPQALRNAQKGGSSCAALVQLILLVQLLLQGLCPLGIVHKAAQHRGGQMGMTVHKTGDGNHTGAVHDGGGLFRGGILANIRYFSVCDTDVCAKKHIHPLVHSDRSHIGN